MTPLVAVVKPYVIHYGYWAIFLGVFLESLGLPLPGETLIVVAGLVAAKGILDINWIIPLAILATFIANNFSYVSGYLGGHNFLVKYGKYVFLNEKRLESLENFVKQHGSKVLVIARFIIGMRQFNGFISGTAKMPFLRFAVFNLIGAILWVGWWAGLSYYFGKKFDNEFIKYYFLIGVIAFAFLVLIACRFSRNKDKILSLKNQPAV